MKINTILFLAILLSTLTIHSQTKTKEKIFTTSDSLTLIHLLPHQKFGYISYEGVSPLKYYYRMRKSRYAHSGFSHPLFEVDESGSGTYSIIDNTLHLHFIQPKHAIDSISIKKTQTTSDSLHFKISFKHYIKSTNYEMFAPGSTVISKDSTINVDSGFENFVTFSLQKNKLPIELIINENYPLTITEKQHHDIELFINGFKKWFVTKNIKDKQFNLKELIQLKKGTRIH